METMSDKFTKSLQGSFLLDSGALSGSFFHRTVVLLCRHDKEGAFGLVINRPTDNLVGEVLQAEIPEVIRKHKLYLGGPVQTNALSYIYTDDFEPQNNILPQLSVGHSLEDLVELGDSDIKSRKIRLFAGYSGWSPGQLEGELKRNAWLVHPASIDLVFSVKPRDLWKRILIKKGMRYRLLAESPDDPTLN